MRIVYTFNVDANGHDCGTIFNNQAINKGGDFRWVWRHSRDSGGSVIRRFKDLKEVHDHFGLLAKVDRFTLKAGITGPLDELTK